METFHFDSSLGEEVFTIKEQEDDEHDCEQTDESLVKLTKSQIAHLRESPIARQRRLARNAERMREKRASETYDEYRSRLEKNALNNRQKRNCETQNEKAVRHVRDAARQRMRRAMETEDQRTERLGKLAERMRFVRMNETSEKRALRLAKAAQRSRDRLLRETSEERKHRLAKSCEYARRMRGSKSISESESVKSDTYKHRKRRKGAASVSSLAGVSMDAYEDVDSNQTESQQCSNVQYLQYENVLQSTDNCVAIATLPQVNPQYLQFTAPMTYTMAPAAQYSIVPQNQTVPLTISDPKSVSIVIQPIGSSFSNTFSVPHYQNIYVPTTSQDQLNVVKVEPVSSPEPIVRPRGRPRKRVEPTTIMFECPETLHKTEVPVEDEEKRRERLRITAEKSRIRRMHETMEQRDRRLKDLKDRAKKRRDQVKMSETPDERTARLAQQAEYARARRLKLQASEKKREALQASDKPSVLQILEPIIELNT